MATARPSAEAAVLLDGPFAAGVAAWTTPAYMAQAQISSALFISVMQEPFSHRAPSVTNRLIGVNLSLVPGLFASIKAPRVCNGGVALKKLAGLPERWELQP